MPCTEFGNKRSQIPDTTPIRTKPLQLILTDISGKINDVSFGVFQYFALFLDYNKARTADKFLEQKSELLKALQKCKALVENALQYMMLQILLDKACDHFEEMK